MLTKTQAGLRLAGLAALMITLLSRHGVWRIIHAVGFGVLLIFSLERAWCPVRTRTRVSKKKTAHTASFPTEDERVLAAFGLRNVEQSVIDRAFEAPCLFVDTPSLGIAKFEAVAEDAIDRDATAILDSNRLGTLDPHRAGTVDPNRQRPQDPNRPGLRVPIIQAQPQQPRHATSKAFTHDKNATENEAAVREDQENGLRNIAFLNLEATLARGERVSATLYLTVPTTQRNRLLRGRLRWVIWGPPVPKAEADGKVSPRGARRVFEYDLVTHRLTASNEAGALQQLNEHVRLRLTDTNHIPVHLFALSGWDQPPLLEKQMKRLTLSVGDRVATFDLACHQSQQTLTSVSRQGTMLTHRGMSLSATAQIMPQANADRAWQVDRVRFVYLLFAPPTARCCLLATSVSIPPLELSKLLRKLMLSALDLTEYDPVISRFGRCFAFQGVVNPRLVAEDTFGTPKASTYLRLTKHLSIFASWVAIKVDITADTT